MESSGIMSHFPDDGHLSLCADLCDSLMGFYDVFLDRSLSPGTVSSAMGHRLRHHLLHYPENVRRRRMDEPGLHELTRAAPRLVSSQLQSVPI